MIIVVDYGMGNVGSILNMLKKIGAPAKVSSDRGDVENASKLILPGVGAFDEGMRNLAQRNLLPVLHERVREKKVPVLGICLGMQLLTERSEEGRLTGLGWLEAETRRFRFDMVPRPKVPHMGWNALEWKAAHPLLADLDGDSRFYFVHSYHVVCRNEDDVVARTRYGYEFASSVAKGNIMGTQFHPEKSHKFGMRLLTSFVRMSA